MKKIIGVVLLAIFALSFVSGILATPTQAISLGGCSAVCRGTVLYDCCGPGPCVPYSRCE